MRPEPTPLPAAVAHLGVLDVLSSTTPRPSSRKRHWIQHLAGLATKPGEKCGLRRTVAIELDPSLEPARAWLETEIDDP